jgi:hypothetical protein
MPAARRVDLLNSRMFIAFLSAFLMFVLCTTTSFACDRPGTPQFIQSHWIGPHTIELEILNKSQADEGSLYYEFSIDGSYSDRQRIENPYFDQRINVTLDTRHYRPNDIFKQFQVQLWARKVENDCRSGGSELYVTPVNPSARP